MGSKFARRLLAGVSLLALPLLGVASPAAAQDDAGVSDGGARGEILVRARMANGAFDSSAVEDELGEADIAGYGDDTVGDLLDEVAVDLGQGEDGPVVMVNGQLATGMDEIVDLPTEAVQRIQLLPREASAALGQAPGRRVVNIVVKSSHRQVTLNGENTFATAGEGRTSSGSATLTRIEKGNRTNITLRVRDVAPLLESDRNLVSRSEATPYDLVGNIIPFPSGGQEIDPALSALAGHAVAVAAVPEGATNPTLAQFAMGADSPNSGDIARYRSLIADTRNYSLNATATRRLGARTSLTATLRAERNESDRLGSAPSLVLQLPETSPFSPFSRDVAIARYLPVGLTQHQRTGSVDASAVLNQRLGLWSLSLTGTYSHRDDRNDNQRSTDTDTLRAGVLAGTINPFAPLSAELLRIAHADSSTTRTDNASTEAVLSGPAFEGPAGPVSVALRLGGRIDRLEGRSIQSGVRTDDDYRRSESNGQVSIDVPLSASDPAHPSALGTLSVNLHAGFRDATVVGTLLDRGVSFNWTPISLVSFRGSLERRERPPGVRLLSDPVLVTPGIRYYDFARNETAEVTYISGGNPTLANEKTGTLTLGATFTPQPQARRNLTVEYTRIHTRNSVSELPQSSLIIQQAFANRFLRDGAGRLIQVDGRPVNFARDEQQQLFTGINLSGEFGATIDASTRRLGQPAGTTEADGESLPAAPTRKAWRYNLSLADIWALSNTRLVRTGIPLIDLLHGGALGFSGGQPRHTIQANAGVSNRNGGLQLNGRWRNGTVLRAGQAASAGELHFSSRAIVSARLYLELGSLLEKQSWAKNTRLTLSAANVFDSKQRVRDAAGVTPLRYQPYLLDPLGRTVLLGIRKVF